MCLDLGLEDNLLQGVFFNNSVLLSCFLFCVTSLHSQDQLVHCLGFTELIHKLVDCGVECLTGLPKEDKLRQPTTRAFSQGYRGGFFTSFH